MGDKSTVVLIASLVVGIIALIWAVGVNENKRQVWLDQHCTITGKIASDLGIGYNSTGNGGMVAIVTPEKTTYSCDDGLVYTE
jgi:hypothetical protein